MFIHYWTPSNYRRLNWGYMVSYLQTFDHLASTREILLLHPRPCYLWSYCVYILNSAGIISLFMLVHQTDTLWGPILHLVAHFWTNLGTPRSFTFFRWGRKQKLYMVSLRANTVYIDQGLGWILNSFRPLVFPGVNYILQYDVGQNLPENWYNSIENKGKYFDDWTMMLWT